MMKLFIRDFSQNLFDLLIITVIFIRTMTPLTTVDINPINLNDSYILGLTESILASDRVFDRNTELIIFITYVTLLSIGFITNFFIIIIFIKKKILREPRSLLFFNLAVSDAVYSILFCPFTLHNILRKSWPFNDILCKIVPAVQGILIFVSSGTVTLISVQRTLIITGPLSEPSSLRLFKREFLLLGQIWLIAALLSSPIFIYQTVKEVGILGVITIPICGELWPTHGRSYYTLVLLIAQWIVPLTTMTVCHYKVDTFLKRNNKARVRLLCFNELDSKKGGNVFYSKLVTHVLNKRDIRDKLRRNTKVTRALLKNTLIFGIIWIPLNITNLYLDFYPDTELPSQAIYLSQAISQIIAVISPISNAYLYYWSNTNIRKEVKRFSIWSCLRSQAPPKKV